MRLHVSLFSSTLQLSLLPRWPHLAKKKKKQQSTGKATMQYPLSGSRVRTCTGIVKLFKHHLCETTHTQFLVLELQAPTGACPVNKTKIISEIHE